MDLKSTGSNPVFPNMHSYTYSHTINHLNLITTKKNAKVKILINRRGLTLLRALHEVGCVSKFIISKGYVRKTLRTYAYISAPFYKNTAFFKSVRVVSTPSKHHQISLRGLKLITHSLNASIMLLSTSGGIITHREALKLGVGGKILCMVH